MKVERAREVVRRIAEMENGPQLLRDDPKALANALKLRPQEVAALFSGDLQLVHISGNPLAGTTTYTFTTGTTIAARQGRFVRLGAKSNTTFTFDTGSTITAGIGPSRLGDLSQAELIRVLSRSLSDPDYADRLRRLVR